MRTDLLRRGLALLLVDGLALLLRPRVVHSLANLFVHRRALLLVHSVADLEGMKPKSIYRAMFQISNGVQIEGVLSARGPSVGLILILVVSLSARFCLGRWNLVRNSLATGQYG